MLPRRPPKRLFKNKDVIHAYEHDRSAKGRIKHMSRDHIDVLYTIESALVSQWRQDRSIDDRMIDEALRLHIKESGVPDDADRRVVVLFHALEEVRAFREDLPSNIWIAGLRTVSESARRHSSCLAGQTRYLDFVKDYGV